MNHDQKFARSVKIPLGDGNSIEGDLTIPADAKAIIIFAHGSGSNRYSTRNNYVSEVLNEYRLATLLVDLLTPEEKQSDTKSGGIRFDIELLTERLIASTNWLTVEPRTSDLVIGYFGSSTGAASALLAASRLGGLIKAIVSRGGRLDLVDSKEIVRNVTAPTLLIVGKNETAALVKANRKVLSYLRQAKAKELVTIDGAGHLFEEGGRMEKVSKLACEWFECYLSRSGNKIVNGFGRRKTLGFFPSFRDISFCLKFKDRTAAGEVLASILGKYENEKQAVVIGIPRGGVVVAATIARKLNCELGLVICKKLVAPDNKENAVGAVMHDGSIYLDESAVKSFGASNEYINGEIERQREEIDRSLEFYRPIMKLCPIENRTVILVDDGAATGATLTVAARWIRKHGPKCLVIAVPVAPKSVKKQLQAEADFVEVIKSSVFFEVVEQFYQDFSPVQDTEVLQALNRESS